MNNVNEKEQFDVGNEQNLKKGIDKAGAQERTNWRDDWPSIKHRAWGISIPVADFDCILSDSGSIVDETFRTIEFDYEEPFAIIEYKEQNANVRLNSYSIKIQKVIADKCNIPFFISIYFKETACFYIIPMNKVAKEKNEWLSVPRLCSEYTYVKLLYWLRNKSVPDGIASTLSKKVINSEHAWVKVYDK